MTLEIGTHEVIKGFVTAVKFREDGDIWYDLRIPVDIRNPDIFTVIEGVSSALVSVVKASTYQPALEG